MMQTKFYSAIAMSLAAMRNCEEKANDAHTMASYSPGHFTRVANEHEFRINALIKEHAPHGSGFDAGTKLDFDKSTVDKLVFKADFHHMDDHGYYCGWTEHEVIVKASLAFGFSLKVTGRDKRQIKDFIADTFHTALLELTEL